MRLIYVLPGLCFTACIRRSSLSMHSHVVMIRIRASLSAAKKERVFASQRAALVRLRAVHCQISRPLMAPSEYFAQLGIGF